MTLHLRVAAAQATFDAYHLQPFVWGRTDCVRLAAHMMRGLGYKPRLHRGGSYSSEIGAAKALLRAGFRDPAEWMDDFGVLRIAPAAALPGDILGFRHPDQAHGWTGLSVSLGQGRVLAFMADGDGSVTCHAGPPVFGVEGAEYMAWCCPPLTKGA